MLLEEFYYDNKFFMKNSVLLFDEITQIFQSANTEHMKTINICIYRATNFKDDIRNCYLRTATIIENRNTNNNKV